MDLSTLDLNGAELITTSAEVSVRTIRNLGNGARVGRWSNTVIWVRE